MKGDLHDPKALIREAYQIEGITGSQCRSIFLDWALSVPEGMDTQQSLAALVERYTPDHPDHPMSDVLKSGQQTMSKPKRRGGWRSRPRD